MIVDAQGKKKLSTNVFLLDGKGFNLFKICLSFFGSHFGDREEKWNKANGGGGSRCVLLLCTEGTMTPCKRVNLGPVNSISPWTESSPDTGGLPAS